MIFLRIFNMFVFIVVVSILGGCAPLPPYQFTAPAVQKIDNELAKKIFQREFINYLLSAHLKNWAGKMPIHRIGHELKNDYLYEGANQANDGRLLLLYKKDRTPFAARYGFILVDVSPSTRWSWAYQEKYSSGTINLPEVHALVLTNAQVCAGVGFDKAPTIYGNHWSVKFNEVYDKIRCFHATEKVTVAQARIELNSLSSPMYNGPLTVFPFKNRAALQDFSKIFLGAFPMISGIEGSKSDILQELK
jgi:hypothetical protein